MNDFLRRSAAPLLVILFFVFSIMSANSFYAYANDAEIEAESETNEKINSTQDPKTLLLEYLAIDQTYEQRLQDILRANLVTISYECQDITGAKRLDPFIYEQIKFKKVRTKNDETYHIPAYGMWRDSFELSGCGKSYRFNFLAVASESLVPTIFPLVNGNSIIDPIYLRQAERKSFEEVGRYRAELCDKGGRIFVTDTKFINYIQQGRRLGPENQGKGWFEDWTIWYCRRVENVRVAVIEQINTSFEIMVRFKQ